MAREGKVAGPSHNLNLSLTHNPKAVQRVRVEKEYKEAAFAGLLNRISFLGFFRAMFPGEIVNKALRSRARVTRIRGIIIRIRTPDFPHSLGHVADSLSNAISRDAK